MKKTLILGLITIVVSISGCTFNVSTGTNSANTTAANTAPANTTASPAAENKANSAPANTGSTETAVSIDTFSDFPEEVDGCSCYLSTSDGDFKAKKYVYIDNREDFATMKLNGAMVKFKRTEEKEVSKNRWVKKFTSGDYELEVDITQSGTIGPFPHKGTLKLTKKGGQTITKEVNGECGC
ncbi:MAG TPA: hypothetical protein PKY82_04750 [Pyrinomonadaceae bacterium]|nr:hypothetical protein [Pyrinomonadaceae bacterium]